MQDKHLFILEHLKNEMEMLNVVSVITEQDEINILRAEIPDLGRAENDVILEIMSLPFDVEEGQRLFQFYTTIAMNMDDDNLLPAIIEVNRMNIGMPIGMLGIFEGIGQMYHKYTMIIEEEWSDETVLTLCTSTLFSIINILDLIYDEAIIISNDVSDLERFRELVKKESSKKAELSEMLGIDDDVVRAVGLSSEIEDLLSGDYDDDDLDDEDSED